MSKSLCSTLTHLKKLGTKSREAVQLKDLSRIRRPKTIADVLAPLK
jgi:hypothetical protein